MSPSAKTFRIAVGFFFLSLLGVTGLIIRMGAQTQSTAQQNYSPGQAAVSNLIVCGTTSSCTSASLTNGHVIFGSAPLVSGSPSTVTITGINPPFTNTTSWKCVANDNTTPATGVSVSAYNSSSSFTITGPATVSDTVSFICAGN